MKNKAKNKVCLVIIASNKKTMLKPGQNIATSQINNTSYAKPALLIYQEI